MRKEYELGKLEVKRRGPLPGLEGTAERPAKVRITIALDQDIVEHFKERAKKPGALPYQTQINQLLRRVIELDEAAAVKDELLNDSGFIRAIAERVRHLSAA